MNIRERDKYIKEGNGIMEQINGGVTAAKGFEAAGTAANIKY